MAPSDQTHGAPASVSRRRFLATAGTAAVATAGAAAVGPGRAQAARRPNIVFILADDLGYGALGCYGQQFLHTPNLDRMAAEGVRFTDAYAGAAICAPSRCSLLTGMHTGHARVRNNAFVETGEQPTLQPQDTTFAQVLSAGGYATGIFGKWGFGDDDAYVPQGFGNDQINSNPQDSGGPRGDLDQNVKHFSHPLQKGFDEFVGMVRHHHATEGYYPHYLWDGNERFLIPENDEADEVYAPDLYVDRALDFMDRKQDEPFACYLSLQLAHWPNLIPSVAPYEDEPWPIEMKRYAAQITLIDTIVGRVRAKLEELGLDENTLVMFSSDNGHTEERLATGSGNSSGSTALSIETGFADVAWDISGGLRGSKHTIYEGGFRVPMIAWGPGIVGDPGRDDPRPWAFWDLLPTFAELAGVAPPSDVDGVSVLPWITGSGDVDHPALYWERPPYAGIPSDGDLPPSATYSQVVRREQFKLIRHAPDTSADHPDNEWIYQLYDVVADPGETVELSLITAQVVAELTAIMHQEHSPAPFARAPWEADAAAGSRSEHDGAAGSVSGDTLPPLLAATGGGLAALGAAALAGTIALRRRHAE